MNLRKLNVTLFSFNGVLLSLVTLMGTSEAFVVHSVGQRAFVSSLKDTAESEWYSPPAQVAVYPPRKPGVTRVETIVESPSDIETFLQEEEDGRLTIVKYHAEWYVSSSSSCELLDISSLLLC
jgi:hypothetical protein